jgi:hypothetical protein
MGHFHEGGGGTAAVLFASPQLRQELANCNYKVFHLVLNIYYDRMLTCAFVLV